MGGAVSIAAALSLLVGCLGPREAIAHVSLPAILGDHMVLQQQAEVVLWGSTDRRKGVSVVTSWDHKEYRTMPDREGKWKLHVRTPKAGGPYEIVFDDGDPRTLKDVLIGEVWLCSGQSNMEFKLSRSAGAEDAIREADFPQIRYFNVKRQYGEKPFDDAAGSVWVRTSPDTAGSFSAVAYYFARKLHRETGVPVGIVHASWGGTPAEAWTPPSALAGDPRLRIALTRWETWERDSAKDEGGEAKELALYMTSRPHREPGVLFNGMISPVIPYTLKGFLWYQGESNIRWAGEYEHLLTTLIESWREAWRGGGEQDAALPFYIVQLPPFGYSDLESASIVREAQQGVADEVDHAGMVTTSDVGNLDDIHPTRKREVGERLARLALARAYGIEGIAHSGPVYRRAVVAGSRVRIHFDHTDGGLRAGDGDLSGFEMSSQNQPSVFRSARARIDGRTVVVWNDDIRAPAAVRYGWAGQIQNSSLFNGASLPAAPFRTDSSPGTERPPR
jgi:sialate O-acetylesterase